MLTGGERLTAKMEEYLEEFGKGDVLRVGFLENATYINGTPVALVAATNEFGNPANNQPPRPYFRIMIGEHKGHWGDDLAEAYKYYKKLTPAFLAVGEQMRGELQESINKLMEPPLSEVTIAKKGFSKPLIETSNMVNSVDYDVAPASSLDTLITDS